PCVTAASPTTPTSPPSTTGPTPEPSTTDGTDMTGRLLLVYRLLMRDLRRHPTETVLLLIAVTAATATLTLGLTLNAVVADPYQRTRAVTAGPDVVVEPGATGSAALAALAPLP